MKVQDICLLHDGLLGTAGSHLLLIPEKSPLTQLFTQETSPLTATLGGGRICARELFGSFL